METTVSKIMGSKNSSLILDITNKNKKTGQVLVRGERGNSNNDVLKIKMDADINYSRSFLRGDFKPMVSFHRN